MKKRVNAGIKSKGELADRLKAGEVFYIEGCKEKMYYDEKAGGSPYRYDDGALDNGWRLFKFLEVEVEVKWYDNITKPVLCLIWDDVEPDIKAVTFVSKYDEELDSFIGLYGIDYDNAKPLTDEELEELGLKRIEENE